MSTAGDLPLDRSTSPPAAALKPFRFPAFEHHSLPNGLQVYLAKRDQAPLVQLELAVAAGAQFDLSGSAGLASLTAALLDEGTNDKSALEIASEVESLGGYLGTSADWDAAYLSTTLLSDHLDAGLRLLNELATSPSFPQNEIERLRRQRLADLMRRLSEPATLAADALARILYSGTVYSYPLPGTPETVEAISSDDIDAFYRRHFAPQGASLIAVGQLDSERLLRQLETTFGAWNGDLGARPISIEPPQLGASKIEIVDRHHAVQTELHIGHVGVSRKHHDFVPLQVVNTLFGGKFSSRINLNLRERHGITYGAHSHFAARLGPGPFVIATSVATEFTGQAVEETLGELRRLLEEPVNDEEVEDTKSFLLGTLPYTLQRIDGLARRLEILAVNSFPDDYYDTQFDAIRKVDVAQVSQLANRHIRPEQIVVVAVGPAESLEKQLRGFGSLTIRELADPHPDAKL